MLNTHKLMRADDHKRSNGCSNHHHNVYIFSDFHYSSKLPRKYVSFGVQRYINKYDELGEGSKTSGRQDSRVPGILSTIREEDKVWPTGFSNWVEFKKEDIMVVSSEYIPDSTNMAAYAMQEKTPYKTKTLFY